MTSLSSRQVTVFVPCVKCGKTAGLTYSPLTEDAPRMHTWICPYEPCRRPNTIGVQGTTLFARVANTEKS
jgi:hypothetical protein